MRKNPEQERVVELEEQLEDIRDQISSVLEDEEDRDDERPLRNRRRR